VYGYCKASAFTGLLKCVEEQLKAEDIDWLEDKPQKRSGGF